MGPINSKDKSSAEFSPTGTMGDNEASMNESRVDIQDSEKARETTSEEPKIGLPEGAVGDCMLGITVIFLSLSESESEFKSLKHNCL